MIGLSDLQARHRQQASLSISPFRSARRWLLVALTLLATNLLQPAFAQNNWQQQQWQQQQRQMEMQRQQQQQRQMEMQRQQQMRQQQDAMRQQQMRQQQAQRSQQWGGSPQKSPQRWQGPSQATAPRQQWQRPAQRSQQAQTGIQRPQGSGQSTVGQYGRPIQRAAIPQQSTLSRWTNRTAAYLRNMFNWERGVTTRNRPPPQAAAVRPARPLNNAEIQRGFRGRVVGDRAVVTVNGRTYTVPRSMVQSQGNRGSAQRIAAGRPAAGTRNGALPRRFVLSGGRGNGGIGGGQSSSGGGPARPKYAPSFNKAAADDVRARAVRSPAITRPNISEQRATHILYGDHTGGGHLWPGGPGKSPFPKNWSANRILNEIEGIATDSTIQGKIQRNGRVLKVKRVDGVDVNVVFEAEARGGGVVTAFPSNVPRNSK